MEGAIFCAVFGTLCLFLASFFIFPQHQGQHVSGLRVDGNVQMSGTSTILSGAGERILLQVRGRKLLLWHRGTNVPETWDKKQVTIDWPTGAGLCKIRWPVGNSMDAEVNARGELQ